MTNHIFKAAATTVASALLSLSTTTTSAFVTITSNNPRTHGSANIIHDNDSTALSFLLPFTEAAESSDTISSPLPLDMPLPPYSKWEWDTHFGSSENTKTTHSINYLSMGDATKPTLLLVHGFGASSYHFRYNIPELAKDYHVYAIDMLGFGWSDKPIMDYDTSVWRDQVIEFIDQIIFKEKGDKSIAIAGNSLGGYTAMYAASDDRIKEHVRGCILLNAAGRFCPEEGEQIIMCLFIECNKA